MILYVKPGCPYCAKVRSKLIELGAKFEERDVFENPEYRDELMEKGGKFQTPFLINPKTGVEMYESDDIIDYLEKNYTDSAQ